ncbi:MAG: DNA mismatch endonuclease Vsr [Candidatus Aminicenantes bacterium]|nr:DNA mismatch endonuclease Vsr [Candidatus Aminicenantes bacterium]
MADVHSKTIRSYNMSQIKGKDTKPEMLVRKFLFAEGFRYRIHQNKLTGKPDLVFPKLNKVVFVHGCFWHGHEKCKYFVLPKTRTEWWFQKIYINKKRDDRNVNDLKKLGWKVIIVWQCQLTPEKRNNTLSSIKKRLGSEK